MKKKFLRCISLLLAVIMLAEMLPTAWFASLLPRVYAADIAAPTETYTVPAAAPTDNTITTDIPPTIVDKTGMSNASECNTQQLNAISDSSETNAPEFYIPEASEVDPQIIYFLNNASAFSQLSVEDAELLISYTGIPALSFSEMEKSGITLFDSITYASLASDARCSVSELLALDLSLNDVRPIVRELAFFNAILRDDLSDTNLAQKLRNFILLGCSCKQVFSAYGVNQVFEIPMDDLLGISADIAMPTGLSEMEIQKITSLADSFGLSASALARYAVAAGISIDEVVAKQDEFTAKQSELATELQSDGETAPSEDVEDAKNFKVSAPFIYNYNEAEKIALNSGALIYECTDYVLPGANGLDLVIGRRYNSQDAFVYSPNKYSKYCAVYTLTILFCFAVMVRHGTNPPVWSYLTISFCFTFRRTHQK